MCQVKDINNQQSINSLYQKRREATLLPKKHEGRLVWRTEENGCNLSVMSVSKNVKKKYRITEKVKNIIVQRSAKELLIQNFLFGNMGHIGELERLEKIDGFTMSDTEKPIPNAYPTSKQGGMREKEKPMVHIPLKSGKNFVGKEIGDAGIVIVGKNLQKTISNLFLLMEQIISQTSNLFVALVIVANGKSFTKIQIF